MTDHDCRTGLLQRQLERTRATWARLQKHGVSNEAELQLDFFFEAPTNARAIELKAFLEKETDYELHVTADEDQWMIHGRTQPALLSLPIVERWVDWMVTAGLLFDCILDGWGAELPTA